MVRERARLASLGREEIELPGAQEEDRLAVGRPAQAAGRWKVAAVAERELHGRAAAGALSPEVVDRAIERPVRVAEKVDERAAVRRELRHVEPRELGEIDERHRLRTLRAWGR